MDHTRLICGIYQVVVGILPKFEAYFVRFPVLELLSMVTCILCCEILYITGLFTISAGIHSFYPDKNV